MKRKTPGPYAPLPFSFHGHPKTKLVARVGELAPYAFLALVVREAEQHAFDQSGEIRYAHDEFAIHALIPQNEALEATIRRYLSAYQLVGWITILGVDEVGFHVRLRNSGEWGGELAKSPTNELTKEVEEEPDHEAEVQEVHAHWKTVFDQPKSRLGKAIAGHIRARLREGRTVDELKQAIDGCAASQWHRDNGQIGLSLICRNDEKVIQFMARAPKRRGQSFNDDMGIA